jgi:hypothetical protein
MWHHLMVTWEQESGRTKLYFDGRPQSAFWVRVLMTAAALHTGNCFLNTNVSAGVMATMHGMQ